MVLQGTGVAVRFKTADGWTEWVNAGEDEPDTITADSANGRTGRKHTHAVDKATLEKAGVVRLSSATDSEAEDMAATPKAVKAVKDHADAGDAAVRRYVDEKIVAVGSAENGFKGMPLVADAHVGAVAYFDREEAPPGWRIANGDLLQQAEYPDLFAVLGRRYGKDGDADGTFRLPEARAEFIRGLDFGRGEDAGRTLGSWQQATVSTVGRHYHGTAIFGGPTKREYGTGPWDTPSYDICFMQGPWNDGTDPEASVNYPKVGFGYDPKRKRKVYTAKNTTNETERQTGYFGGTITSLDIPASSAGAGQGANHPRNIALLCCIKVSPATIITVASADKAGLVKLYRGLAGNEEVTDGALSLAGVKQALDVSKAETVVLAATDAQAKADAAVAAHTDAVQAHTWVQIGGKPETFPPDTHDHTWADVTGKPETLSGYGITDAVALQTYTDKVAELEQKIQALTDRVAALESSSSA